MNDDAAVARAQFQKVMTILNDGNERNGFLLELVAAGFDA